MYQIPYMLSATQKDGCLAAVHQLSPTSPPSTHDKAGAARPRSGRSQMSTGTRTGLIGQFAAPPLLIDSG
ncbi:hypothetical protein J6590_032835 [Homalodisca vitripennis]|nr:hypothetical protein J6590_032835 [Homalodisca vitripennis]